MHSLEKDDENFLIAIYKVLYPEEVISIQAMAETVRRYLSVTIGNQFYCSRLECRSLRSARIDASWPGPQRELNVNELSFFAGYVLYYFSHSIKFNGKFLQHIFACVSWYKPDGNPDEFGNPTLWTIPFYASTENALQVCCCRNNS